MNPILDYNLEDFETFRPITSVLQPTYKCYNDLLGWSCENIYFTNHCKKLHIHAEFPSSTRVSKTSIAKCVIYWACYDLVFWEKYDHIFKAHQTILWRSTGNVTIRHKVMEKCTCLKTSNSIHVIFPTCFWTVLS